MKNGIPILFFIFLLLNYIFTKDNLKGVYMIKASRDNNQLFESFPNVSFQPLNLDKGLNKYYFRIKPINYNIYNIESINNNRKLALDNDNNLKLIGEFNDEPNHNIYWNIIKMR